MKRIFLTLCFLFPIIHNVIANNIPTKGTWEEGGPKRSISLAQPIASINGSIVSVCSPDALAGLNIVINDASGNTVFQQTYSFTAGETIDLPALEDGEYVIVLSHGWRYLMGEFEVE